MEKSSSCSPYFTKVEPGDAHGQKREQFFVQLHQVAIVAVRLVEFEHREFRVVLRRDPLVAEVAVDLVHAVKSADGQALEIELRRDAQIQIDIQCIVVCDEGSRRCASRDGMHHRRFNLYISARIEKAPQLLNNLRAGNKHLSRFVVGNQVQIALPVAQLNVGQPMPLFWKGQQRLGKKCQLVNPDGKFVGFRAEEMSANADQIAKIQKVKKPKAALADNVFLYIDLYALAGTLQMRKSRLAHQPERNKPPRHAYFTLVGFQLCGRLLAILFHKSRGRVRPAKFSWKRFVSESFNLLEFLLALFKLLAGLKLQSEILSKRNHGEYSGHRLFGATAYRSRPTSSWRWSSIRGEVAPTRKSFSRN